MLIPLICSQCGGKLEVENSQVFEADNVLVVLDDQTFKCPHCGVKYLAGEKISRASSSISIGSISIGGNLSGNIIIGNGIPVGNNVRPTTRQEPSAKPQREMELLNANTREVLPESESLTPQRPGQTRWIIAGVIFLVVFLILVIIFLQQ